MKKICLFLCICLITLLTGCYDSIEVDDLAYTVTIGLDKGKEGTILVTFQFVLPSAMSGSGGGGGGGSSGSSGGGSGGQSGGEEQPPSGIKIITVEAATISNAIEIANDFLSKKVSLSHAVMVIMGMDFATENLDTYWKEIFMSNDFNPDMYVAVCKEDAKSFIEKIDPKLDVNPAEYLEYTINSKATVMTTTSNIYEIYTRTLSDSGDAYATMCALSKKEKEDLSADQVAQEDYMAGDVPKEGGPETEFVGLAVFSDQTFVGTLTAAESWMVIATEGKLESKSKTIEDPKEEGSYIGANLEQDVSPKIQVDTSGDVPVISVKIPFVADIYSVQSESATTHADYNEIVEHLTSQLEEEFRSFYEKLAKEYQSDILRFGMFAKGNFSTIQEWESYQWQEKYPSAKFKVQVDITVQRQDMYLS